MNFIYLVLYYVWRLFASALYNESFMETQNVPLQYFLGKYFQLVRTPNSFQKTSMASANYYLTRDSQNNATIQLTNVEYIANGINAITALDSINGTLEETKVDPGTYFVSFENVFNVGVYRILKFEIHHQFGTYLLVSSISPRNTWLLWKPPIDKSNLLNSYKYGLSKINWFADLSLDPNSLIVVSPQDLYKMLTF